jgi:hypothetical protein
MHVLGPPVNARHHPPAQGFLSSPFRGGLYLGTKKGASPAGDAPKKVAVVNTKKGRGPATGINT